MCFQTFVKNELCDNIGRYFTYFPLPAHPNISKCKSQTYVSFPHNAVCQTERRNSDIKYHHSLSAKMEKYIAIPS